MKITIINGSPRKGNTYKLTQIFKNQMLKNGPIEFIEFSLPKDMPNFCHGCMSCFFNGEETCPNAKYTIPILNAMLSSDAIILTTPVYVLSTSGPMKSFLDHYGFIFLVHRARPEMIRMKAFVLATTAGAGTRSAIKTINTSLKSWGVNKIHSAGFTLFGTDLNDDKDVKKQEFESKIRRKADKFYKEVISKKKHQPYFHSRMIFYVMRKFIRGNDDSSLDKRYWQEQNWFNKSPF